MPCMRITQSATWRPTISFLGRKRVTKAHWQASSHPNSTKKYTVNRRAVTLPMAFAIQAQHAVNRSVTYDVLNAEPAAG